MSLVVLQKCRECTNSRLFFPSRMPVPRAVQTRTKQRTL